MHVVLFAAQSLDGRITRHREAGDAFASDADKVHFRNEIRICDACVMGGRSYEASKHRMRPAAFPSLRRVVWTRDPEGRASDAVPGVLEFTRESPTQTAARLRADGRRRCAVLGGGEVNAAWLEAGLVDEVCVTVESRIFGLGTALVGRQNGRPGVADLEIDIHLELIEAKALAPGGPLLLRYTVKRDQWTRSSPLG